MAKNNSAVTEIKIRLFREIITINDGNTTVQFI